MNKLAALALLPLVLVPACIPGIGCGGFTGGGDAVYQRGNDVLIECDNGGFVATLSTGTVEGRYTSPTGVGSNGGLAFTQLDNPDTTITTQGMGTGTWTSVELDAAALDHANTACEQLTTEAWWTAPTDAVPVATELADPNAPDHKLVLCPNYSMYLVDASGAFTGNYNLALGELDATTVTNGDTVPNAITGQLDASGDLVVTGIASNSASSTNGANPATVTWQQTTADASAAQSFCATGVFGTTLAQK